MSCCDAPGLLPFEEAQFLLAQIPRAALTISRVPLALALNQITAHDIGAPFDIPNYDNSAMDGYALNSTHWQPTQPLKLIGKSFAGAAFEGEVSPGECIRIMTGAKVPKGCTCVVMQENTEVNNTQVFVTRPITTGDNIRPAGNDVKRGQQVLNQGTRIGPRAIGMLATLGYSEVEVYRPLRVGVFSTGDEITPLGSALEDGYIYDSNRYLIQAALEKLGMTVENFGALPDRPDVIEETLLQAVDRCDAVVSSGGVSVGDADFMREILSKLGEITFYNLAMKPGKPFAYGTIHHDIPEKNTPFFGLPGNPVSAAVTFHQLATPALKRIAGEEPKPSLMLQAVCRDPLNKKPGRCDFQRGILSRNIKGQLEVKSSGNQSSGALLSLVNANSYILLETERGAVQAGEIVDVIPITDEFA